MAKYPVRSSDPYLDEHSGILRNRLGITDQAELDRVEATFGLVRAYELAENPVAGKFDLAHLQAIHKRLFGDVYDWAGEIRTVDISKGQTRFANFQQIESYAPEITRPLQREQLLRGLNIDTFSERAGHYLGELNVLHPFREGNGRATREFVGQLARGAGYAVDWSGIERSEMIQASIEAYEGSSKRLAGLIRASLVDIDRERALDLAMAVSGGKVQISPAEPGHAYEGAVVGSTERYVVQSLGDEMVLHTWQALLNTEMLVPGQIVNIRYPHGGVGLVEGEGTPRLDKSLQHDHERKRDRDLER
ncbi:Fic/DOC family protein [Achromobacter aegrifaciens]|uniref:protein adenylyltransferase n=1 Tax=Achromobacter aegrifaciens TaxID=1287736 RepID=A0ABU2DEY4_ACHAE|nr:Fic/DOC family protein [Achromobacter aegrifaciens]MDR7946666.1 Fic/DOC family protein [Achromobacter aegrifaciens]